MCASWNARSAYCGLKHSSTDPVWWSCWSVPGIAVKFGSSLIATLTFTVPERVFHRSMSHTKSAGSSCLSSRSRNAIFGWIVVTTTGARSSSPFSSATPTARPPRVEDLRHLGVGADLGAERFGAAADRVAHRAHAALLEPPAAEVAVADVADRVVEHDVGGAGLVGAGPRADHAVDREHRLDRVGLEPVVQQVGDAHREQARDVGDAALTPRPRIFHAVWACAAGHRASCDPTCGGTLQQQRTQHVGDALHPRLPLREGVGVLLRELRDRVVALLRVVGVDGDGAPVGEGLEVRTERRDVVAVPLQVELADDRRRHQRHHVASRW